MTITMQKQDSMILVPEEILEKLLLSLGVGSENHTSSIEVNIDENMLFESEVFSAYKNAKNAPSSDFINI